jgi:hypothetical protein
MGVSGVNRKGDYGLCGKGKTLYVVAYHGFWVELDLLGD